MKILILNIFCLLLLSGVCFSQKSPLPAASDKAPADSSNVLDKINLKFDLEGQPSPNDVGFNDPKGSWKVEYDLRLSDEKSLDSAHAGLYDNCRPNTPEYLKCVTKANKKHDRVIKKTAILISLGKFEKKPLSDESNRETSILVNLAPEVIEIFNRAARTQDNPTFTLRIKSKVSARTADGKKHKFKQGVRFVYPLKQQRKDGSFDYYNVTSFGAAVRLSREENGQIGSGIFTQ